MHPPRSLTHVLCAALLLMLLPTCGSGTNDGNDVVNPPPPPPPAVDIDISLQLIASGIPSPLMLTHAGDGSGRRFVVSQTGQIWIIDQIGQLLATPFLDLAALGVLVTLDGFFDERGLLGLAFHPDFATNGRFFVRYSAPRTGTMGVDPCFGTTRGCHTSVVSEFMVQGNPTTNNVADGTSERVIFTLDQPQFNHDGGHIAFGPDGFLYIALGDGGGAHDGLADNPPSHGPIGHGQDKNTLLGSILRIDVDTAPPMGQEYVVPPDNPFVGVAGADEIWAYGLRNPYRFCFDDRAGGTNALICADVGQNLWEEVDIITKGGNYGWVTREGFACFDPFDPDNSPANCSAVGPSGEPLLDPVLAYAHNLGLAIIGGHVYRGQSAPDLVGKYVFGDWSTSFGDADGHMFAAAIDGPNAWVMVDLLIQPGNQDFGRVLLGFGEDEGGELYVMGSTVSAPGGNGDIFRITAP